jgi:hypothetical protein
MKYFINKLTLVSAFFLATACMQSHRGIETQGASWVWNPVDFCETWPTCENSAAHMIGTVHYDENFIEFKIMSLPAENTVSLASDESITYRIIAKRPNDGSWHLMQQLNYYGGKSAGKSENMLLDVDQVIRLKPYTGYIEQYNNWILERVVQKGSEVVPYGNGDRIWDELRVQYSELNTNK